MFTHKQSLMTKRAITCCRFVALARLGGKPDNRSHDQELITLHGVKDRQTGLKGATDEKEQRRTRISTAAMMMACGIPFD
ncbi:uncharacterized protein BDW70DRAFT_135811 [Aspergillus foveolatus]|uniref:uncharacterized protein n=1 Tax=Aspergillus foveolatus TaxID=210207 RepID=UPI003CCCD111